MAISLFEFFSIGIGPSSSHTVGPMRAAARFIHGLKSQIDEIKSVVIELYGSLAMTGQGHGTDKAIALGLMGFLPENVDPEEVQPIISAIDATKSLSLLRTQSITFDFADHLIYHKHQFLPYHSNAMRLHAIGENGQEITKTLFYSVGGGFIVTHEEAMQEQTAPVDYDVPYPFTTAKELLAHCDATQQSIAQIVLSNELTFRTKEQIEEGILKIWSVMEDSVRRGFQRTERLPGPLNMKRRAPDLYQKLLKADPSTPTYVMDWTSLFALAVSEENGAGGRIVTAPTNGAAGVIPAVLHYAQKFLPHFSEEKVIEFFLTAGAIVSLYKQGASLSAAEMGCQGEIGVASSMAAAGLCAINGGTPYQIENAAEIAMEHHLGLTCDPVAGLVQIPCIERNTMGAIKAINAASLALSTAEHYVHLDDVIKTMFEVGKDMHSKYKETSEGGLAKNIQSMMSVC